MQVSYYIDMKTNEKGVLEIAAKFLVVYMHFLQLYFIN